MTQPTKKQTALLNYIEKFTAEHNYSPSYREIMRALNLNSVSAVAEHVDNCVARGYLKKVPHAARSLRVLPRQDTRETAKLFRAKLSDLNSRLSVLEEQIKTNPFSATKETTAKINSLSDDIKTLKSAAKLLKIKL